MATLSKGEIRDSADLDVQCVRCRHRHKQSERKAVRLPNGIENLVCPRCACKSQYDIKAQVAWCWASGLVEVGDVDAVPAGSIVIARGPCAFLLGALSAVCRQGKGASAGKFLVPGVPEADDQRAAGDALASWLTWCAKGNEEKHRQGVVFETEKGK